MELVDRNDLITALSMERKKKAHDAPVVAFDGGVLGLTDAIGIVGDAPVIHARPVRHELWNYSKEKGHYCTGCGETALNDVLTAYCPVCGARMDDVAVKTPERDAANGITAFEREIFQSALDQYGDHAQIAMVMEEMSELQKELCKNLRGADNVRAIAEEVADVGIMLDQMKLLFRCEWDAEQERALKVSRLQQRIASERDAHDLEWVKEGAEDGV